MFVTDAVLADLLTCPTFAGWSDSGGHHWCYRSIPPGAVQLARVRTNAALQRRLSAAVQNLHDMHEMPGMHSKRLNARPMHASPVARVECGLHNLGHGCFCGPSAW